MSEVTAPPFQHDPASLEPPALHHELEPWRRVFWNNLTDLVLHREPPPLETTSQPVAVPPETFINTGLGARHYLESYGYHVALVMVIYFASTSSWFNRPVQLNSPFENTTVDHYPLSDYLPPINTGPRGEAKPRKGAPKLAKQEILSVPANPDNNHQTIVTPPNVKLNRDVPLPNIVAWTTIPGQPIAASSRQLSQLKLPQFAPQVVEPTADVSKLKSRTQVQSGAAHGRATDGRRVEREGEADDAGVGATVGGGASAVARPVEVKARRDEYGANGPTGGGAETAGPAAARRRSGRCRGSEQQRQERSGATQHSGTAVVEGTGADYRAGAESGRRTWTDRGAERQSQRRVSRLAGRQA